MLAEWIKEQFNWKALVKCIVFCTIDFAIPLWYLVAMIEVYIVWYFIVKTGNEKRALKLIPFLFLALMIQTSYCETKGLDWFWKMNFVTRAMSWFLMGYYLNTENAAWLKKWSNMKLAILDVVGCVILVIPTVFKVPVRFNIVGTLPCATGLFVLAINNSGKSINGFLEFIGEKLSLSIYIMF